jgi:hypothetical protein
MDVALRVTVARKLQSGSVTKFLLPWFLPRVTMTKRMTIVMRMVTERKRMMILPPMRRKMRKCRPLYLLCVCVSICDRSIKATLGMFVSQVSKLCVCVSICDRSIKVRFWMSFCEIFP